MYGAGAVNWGCGWSVRLQAVRKKNGAYADSRWKRKEIWMISFLCHLKLRTCGPKFGLCTPRSFF